MASITNEPNGRRVVQFYGSDGKRRSIRLGKVTKAQAESVARRVDDLLASAITGSPLSRETAVWLSNLDDDMHDKLARVGLVASRERATLGPFIDGYIELKRKEKIKAGTLTFYGHTRRNLVEFFGESRPLRALTEGDALAFRAHLLNVLPSRNTVARRCNLAKQFFRHAARCKLIDANPFAQKWGEVRGNPDKMFFVTRDIAQQVIDACTDAEWRLVFALARYGGLRVPSEVVGLRWSDIVWERGWMIVHSPKTEHHQGHETRRVPLFPELVPHLLEVFNAAPPGSEFVVMRYRDAKRNLRTRLDKTIRRAGLQPWPKPWQNLRSTRQTELAKSEPMHLVCAWIGNSENVALGHYLQVTDADFARASDLDEAVRNPVRNPVLQAPAGGDTPMQAILDDAANRPDSQTYPRKKQATAAEFNPMQLPIMGREGFEPP